MNKSYKKVSVSFRYWDSEIVSVSSRHWDSWEKKSRSRLGIETHWEKSLSLVLTLRLWKIESRSRLDIETQKKKNLGLVSPLRLKETKSWSQTQKSSLATPWCDVMGESSSDAPHYGLVCHISSMIMLPINFWRNSVLFKKLTKS